MDWLNPTTWDVPAQLAEHWQTIAAAVVGIAGAIGTVAKWGFAPIRWAWSWLRSRVCQADAKDEEIEKLKAALAKRDAEDGGVSRLPLREGRGRKTERQAILSRMRE